MALALMLYKRMKKGLLLEGRGKRIVSIGGGGEDMA